MRYQMLKVLFRLLSSPGALRHIRRHALNPRWFIRNIRRVLQSSGPQALLRHIVNQFDDVGDYGRWIGLNEHFDLPDLNRLRRNLAAFSYRPHFSILLPVFETPEMNLAGCIESVIAQVYPDWELCIAGDASTSPHLRALLNRYCAGDSRIRVVYREHNGHVAQATNSALGMAGGDFICLLDHSDTVSPNALYEFARLLNSDPELDFIYSDEDRLTGDGMQRYAPFFKPEWSPEYLEACMYTRHFSCYRTQMARQLGGFRTCFDGAHDYDFVLRFTAQTNRIAHVARILYHRRTLPGPAADSTGSMHHADNAARSALEAHAKRSGELDFVRPTAFEGCWHLRRRVSGHPKVSIAIPSAGRFSEIRGAQVDLLGHCIRSIVEKSTFKNIELVVVNNVELREETRLALAPYSVTMVRCLAPGFNWAAQMNLAARHCSGEFILFLNDDIEVITPDWLEAMLSVAQRPGVGVVGPKLYFEDGSLQHVGVSLFFGLPGHLYHGAAADCPGYFFSNCGQRNVLALTGACMLVRRTLFEELGGFEERFAINYNDADFCLKAWQRGYRNVFTPQAELYHFESRSRKPRDVSESEKSLFMQRWEPVVRQDPYYSKYFNMNSRDFTLFTGPEFRDDQANRQ